MSADQLPPETHTCATCGRQGTALGWPSPTRCDQCVPTRPTLKPCPFCGIQGAVWHITDEQGSFWVECAVCHARGPVVQVGALAAPMWDRRSDRKPNDGTPTPRTNAVLYAVLSDPQTAGSQKQLVATVKTAVKSLSDLAMTLERELSEATGKGNP